MQETVYPLLEQKSAVISEFLDYVCFGSGRKRRSGLVLAFLDGSGSGVTCGLTVSCWSG